MKAFLAILILLISKFTAHCFESRNYIKVDGYKYNGSQSEIVYKSKIVLYENAKLDLSIDGVNFDDYEFSVIQAHCFHYSISLTIESSQGQTFKQIGSNLGFVIKPNGAKNKFHFVNNNIEDVQCLVAFLVYKKGSPLPGKCFMNNTISESIEMIKIIEKGDFLKTTIPKGNAPGESCEDSNLTYETYYTYLDTLNFGMDAYFDGIEKMIFDGVLKTYQTKHVPLDNQHLLEAIPGRGLIINTVIRRPNGEYSFHIPIATYSCPQNTWSSHCTDSNSIKRGISIVLILFSIVMILNQMTPQFIESVLNGMLVGGFLTILTIKSYNYELQMFDYFILILSGASSMSVLFITFTIYLMPIGKFMTKFNFSAFLAIIVMEIFFDTIVSPFLEVILALILTSILSLCRMTYSVFLGGIILILSISCFMKTGNLHRIFVNNFLALITLPPEVSDESHMNFIRTNYINYRISFSFIDYVLIILYIICTIWLTIRKERYFFEHPNEGVTEGIFVSAQQVRAFNCAVARARREKCILGISRTDEKGHYHVITRCRRHLIMVDGQHRLRQPWMSINRRRNDPIDAPAGPSTSGFQPIRESSSSSSTEEADEAARPLRRPGEIFDLDFTDDDIAPIDPDENMPYIP